MTPGLGPHPTNPSMTLQSIQAPGAVVTARPHRFHPNPAPAADNAVQRSARRLPLAMPTIEMAGGSVRSVVAGVHFARR